MWWFSARFGSRIFDNVPGCVVYLTVINLNCDDFAYKFPGWVDPDVLFDLDYYYHYYYYYYYYYLLFLFIFHGSLMIMRQAFLLYLLNSTAVMMTMMMMMMMMMMMVVSLNSLYPFLFLFPFRLVSGLSGLSALFRLTYLLVSIRFFSLVFLVFFPAAAAAARADICRRRDDLLPSLFIPATFLRRDSFGILYLVHS